MGRSEETFETDYSSTKDAEDPFSDYRIIQNWTIVKPLIQNLVQVQKGEDVGFESTKRPQASTISHGFQTIKVLEHGKSPIWYVSYVPSSSLFLSFDKEFMHQWRSGVKFQKLSIQPKGSLSSSESSKIKDKKGLYNISNCIYVESFHVYIVSTRKMELKLLDLQYVTLLEQSTPKHILWYCLTNSAWNIAKQETR
jgi:hypothetical protein